MDAVTSLPPLTGSLIVVPQSTVVVNYTIARTSGGPIYVTLTSTAADVSQVLPNGQLTWFTSAFLSTNTTAFPSTQVSSGPTCVRDQQPTQQTGSTPTESILAFSSPGIEPGEQQLSNGAIAGVAIGAAVIGAVFSSIIAILLLRRRRQDRSHPEYIVAPSVGKDKDMAAFPASDSLRLDDFLLDVTPESKMSDDLRSLGHLIQHHVETNYHRHSIPGSTKALAQSLAKLGTEPSPSTTVNQLAALAEDPRTRYQAIRHVIAKVVFTSSTLGGITPVSLLPSGIATTGLLIPPTENLRGSHEAVDVALTRWRQLSAFLLHPHRSDRTPLTPTENVMTQQAQKLAVALNIFLQPFVVGGREGQYEQENHLREVIVECAAFGYVIFSQPAEYRFIFDSNGKTNGIVVCPGLEKISDEDGRRFSKAAQPVATPVTESV